MRHAHIIRALIIVGFNRSRERWYQASRSLKAQLAVMTPPAIAEAFFAWAAGLGTAMAITILCAHMMNGARQWAAGIEALVPVRIRGQLPR